MQYYRCRCGKSAAYGSMGPFPCDFCDSCGSDLAMSPEFHRTPQPHDWVTQPVDVDGGQAVLTRCAWCGIKKSKWEADGSPMSPETAIAYGLSVSNQVRDEERLEQQRALAELKGKYASPPKEG